MSEVTADQLAALAPFIAGAKPDDRGELEIYCPMHPDTRRSASVNVRKGVWYCHAGCGGSSVRQLLLNEDAWVPADGRVQTLSRPVVASSSLKIPTAKEVRHWHRRLRRERGTREALTYRRALNDWTIRKAQIGWDGRYYKIPVWSPDRRLWNVRNYDMQPTNGRSKIWSTRGMGRARLYPSGILERVEPHDAILFCEGEWDALLALQYGFFAITRTDGAGKPWYPEWTHAFAGLRVYLCHDRDRAGDKGNAIVGAALAGVCDVYQTTLPFRWREKGGRDMTDYLMTVPEDVRPDALKDLLDESERVS